MLSVPKIKPKRQKHDYTSELELKSILIRIKNKRLNIGTTTHNNRIDKYIKWFTAINNKKYAKPQRRNLIKAKLKSKIIELSEITSCNRKVYERFGCIILLMIKNILRKPQFSGYTYKDDFYSDAVYKILKYLCNFDHKLISSRTGQPVNAFAYISQIIHNSVLYIIITKKKENNKLKDYTQKEQAVNKTAGADQGWYADSPGNHPASAVKITRMFYLKHLDNNTLIERVQIIKVENPEAESLVITYPYSYKPTMDEYNKIKELQKQEIFIQREEESEHNEHNE